MKAIRNSKTVLPYHVKTKTILCFLIGLELITFSVYCKVGLRYTIGLMLLLPAILLAFKRADHLLFAFFLYLALIPTSAWGERYPFFHGLAFRLPLFIALAIGFILYLGLTWTQTARSTPSPNSHTLLTCSWLAIVLLAALNGMRAGHPLSIIFQETALLCSYGLIILFIKWFDTENPIFQWNRLLWIGAATTFLYLMLFALEGGLQGYRIVTRQTHVILALLPLFISFAVTTKIRIKKIGAIVVIALMGGAIFVSQQRGLWVGSVIALLTYFILYLLQPGHKKRKILWGLGVFIGLGTAMTLLVLTQPAATQALLKRLFSLLWGLSDPSMQLRLSDTTRVFAQWQANMGSLLIGSGLGAQFESIDPMRTSPYFIDHSWAFLLWKTGLIGCTLFAVMIFKAMTGGLLTLRRAVQDEHKQLSAGLLSGMMGLLTVSFTNGCLVFYRFTPLWAFMLATLFWLDHSHNDLATGTVHESS